MAYRRRQGMMRSATFNQPIYQPDEYEYEDEDEDDYKKNGSSPSAHHPRLSSARRPSSFSDSRGSALHATSVQKSDHYKYGIWGVLAGKAKALLDDKPTTHQLYQPTDPPNLESTGRGLDNAILRNGLDAFTSSLNQIGDTIGNAFEEGRTVVENKTTNMIQDTRKLQIRPRMPTQPAALSNPDTQLKASRDVAMATAAKAKLLLRELKTAKADMVFAKERCTQLEEENKQHRENRVKSDNQTDDDMIRLQLEILLAEKARLAHENSVLARENRFLREIVEYHQLTMQDVLYVDEGGEEDVTVTEDSSEFSITDSTYIYNTPKIVKGNDSLSFSQRSSPGVLKQCDGEPYEEPLDDDDTEAQPNSKPPIHAAQQDNAVSPTSNHI